MSADVVFQTDHDPSETVFTAVIEPFAGLVGALAKLHAPRPDDKKYWILGDIKEQNIFIMGKRWRLGDLDIALESRLKTDNNCLTMKDDYSIQNAAPEVYITRTARRKSNVFSLGCVFLVACVWYYKGAKAVVDFQHARDQELCRLRLENSLICHTAPRFHDGQHLLSSVDAMFNELNAQSDEFGLIGLVIRGMMEPDFAKRPTSEYAYQKLCQFLNRPENHFD